MQNSFIILRTEDWMEAEMRQCVWTLAFLLGSLAFAMIVLAGVPQEKASSRAYVGHENDRDINNFIRQYPKRPGPGSTTARSAIGAG